MSSYPHYSLCWFGLGCAVLAACSLAWSLLARRSLGGEPDSRPARQLLAGLAASVPLLALTLALTVTGQTSSATNAGSGAALTYLLLVPAVLLAGTPAAHAWLTWRRAVLPFCLVTAAMWILMGTTGQFWPLDGQFLVTLFALGTWLFNLEAKAAGEEPKAMGAEATPSTKPDNPSPLTEGLSGYGGEPVTVAVYARAARATGAASGRIRTVPASLLAMGLAILSIFVLAEPLPYRGAYLTPVLGSLTCLGPIWLASKAGAKERAEWAASLGYAAMVGVCLVPGLAGFLQPSIAAPPLYGPDMTFLVLATGLLLSLGGDDRMLERTPRNLLKWTWGIWVAWVVISALLARHPVVPLPAPDLSVWDLP